ncbi:L-aminoadipate-semialdehyde dehydrogenase-phosphopantetheinyl transferase isoform X2 [Eurytemora carolleeae]|uniref:L-aminoadipate-semialdehyde dehydrogenase-phosphopantetheinyl transferase isoform X2 n=1 Tax=Eurytemora carolleeae TaxID=1294199 RepID=UPI000C78B769|nr:L-aminoadipate-semialdehyde dehydrogenase-phosphopantetheinyl transferase isoform X2 [Eurytemora carolleeae]|eukprot:XP_023329617.1 L-aminoadipate-semialdehyde dehydrogenase-phosphopantetheinyl transferase-like isoform X2 [Eurytemora affinis]
MRMSGMNERGVGKCIRWFFNHNNWSPDHQEISRSFAAIQEEEKKRIHQASLVGRLMLRKAVCLLGELTNKQIKFSRTDRGRPFPENLPELEINISHAGDLTVLAAQRVNVEQIEKDENQDRFLLGVDVMPICDSRIDRTENFFRLMRKQFTDYEWETILSKPSEEMKLECFYRLDILFVYTNLHFNPPPPVVPRPDKLKKLSCPEFC